MASEPESQTKQLPHEVRVFLSEVGEAVRDYLETKHRQSRKMGEEDQLGVQVNESSRILSRQR